MMNRSTRSAAPASRTAAELHADQDKGEGEIPYRRVPTYGPVPPSGNQHQSKSNASQFPCKHKRNFYKEGTWVSHRTKLKHSTGDMIQSGTSTRYATAQVQSARGLLWRTL